MNARTIVLILALFSLISTVTGGYLYYHSIQKDAIKEIVEKTDDLKDNIVRVILVNQSQVKSISLLQRIEKALLNQDQATLSAANKALDDFAEGFALDVCYLMDSSGKTIASSNRNNQDSFVGHNYSFRAYFTDAMKGKPGIYWAVGVTSNYRGNYFSHPVYSAGGGQPIGVVVIKASARELDKALSKNKRGISSLVHSSGIIFASNQEDLILKFFSNPSPEELLRIAETKQFGKGPWNWSGFEEKADNRVVDSSGKVYLIQEVGLADCPGWKIVSLYRLEAIFGKIDTLMGKAVYVAIFLLLLLGGAVIVLYVMAQSDITKRKMAEKEKENLIIELQKSLSEIKQLSRILPICSSCKKIRDDEGYWQQVESYISEHSETQFSHSICPDCMRKLYPEYADEVLGHLEKDEKK